MRLKEFTEGSDQPSFVLPKEAQKARVIADKILAECNHAVNWAFYKGIREGVMPEDGSLFVPDVRMSRNTRNYYTLLIDNLPSWQGYPKRGKGLVFSNDYATARSYAWGVDPYRVIPKNGAQLGICRDDDIWTSFPNVYERIESVNQYYERCDISDHTYKGMLADMLKNKECILHGFKELYAGRKSDLVHIVNALKPVQTIEELVAALDDLYNPATNGFTLVDIAQYSKAHFNYREIWTDSPCYMVISNGLIDRMINEPELGKSYWV